MTPASDPRETALKSLTAWWADMGVEPDLPVSAPKPRVRRSEPAPRRTPPPAMQASPATAAAARAAGFGEVRWQNLTGGIAAVHSARK